jgi:hypothetical protein
VPTTKNDMSNHIESKSVYLFKTIEINLSPADVERFWKYVSKGGPDECWPWTGCRNDRGYGQLQLNGKPAVATRISWTIHRGPVPTGLGMLHRCDNPACVNPSHLFAGTQADNVRDRDAKQRGKWVPYKRTNENRGKKLTFEKAQQIRAMYKGRGHGPSQAKIGNLFGVSQEVVSEIILGKIWLII